MLKQAEPSAERKLKFVLDIGLQLQLCVYLYVSWVLGTCVRSLSDNWDTEFGSCDLVVYVVHTFPVVPVNVNFSFWDRIAWGRWLGVWKSRTSDVFGSDFGGFCWLVGCCFVCLFLCPEMIPIISHIRDLLILSKLEWKLFSSAARTCRNGCNSF